MTVGRGTTLRAILARASRWLSQASYLQKWLILGVLIGIMAGLGAIVFYEALEAATHLFLGVLAGYHVPTPAGEGGQRASASFARPWALPLIVGFGALLGALLVYKFAPDAEGHGTDAAISAVHHNPRGIRFGRSSSRSSLRHSRSVRAARGAAKARPARSAPVLARSWPGSSTSAQPTPARRSLRASARVSEPSSGRR